MSVIDVLKVRVAGDINPLDDDFSAALASAADFAREMGSISVAPSMGSMGGGGSGSGMGGGFGASIASDLRAAMGPLNAFTQRFEKAFDSVGGTITTLARRIDLSLKKDWGEKKAKLVGGAMKALGTTIRVAAVAWNPVWILGELAFHKINAGIVKMVAKTAAGITKAASNVGSFFSKIGDVAGKGLGKLGLGRVRQQLQSMTSTSAVAGNGVRALGAQLSTTFGIATGFGAAGAAVGFFSGGIKGAVDMTESLNKLDVVFGKAGGDVKAQADRMADAFGAPKREIIDASSSFGVFAQAAGKSQGDAAAFANQLTTLAMDAKSFHHVGLDDAMAKIQAGLRGQSEPLAEWGVMMNEDMVKAQALKMGLAGLNGEIGEGAKVQARAALIAKGLSYVNGDMAATSGSTANMFDALKGRVGNLATEMGATFLPAIDSVLRGLNDFTKQASAWYQANKASFEEFGRSLKTFFVDAGEAVRGLLGAIVSIGGEVVATIGSMFGGASEAATSFSAWMKEKLELVGWAFRNIGPMVQVAWIRIKEFAINTGEQLGAMLVNFGLFGDWLGKNWVNLIRDACAAVGSIFVNLGKNAAALGSALAKFLSNPTKGFHVEWTPMLDGFKAATAKLPDMMRPELTSLQGEVDKVFEGVAKKERDRAERIRKDAEVASAPAANGRGIQPMGDLDAADKKKKKKHGDDFAGAMDLASKEAYSTIVKASAGNKAAEGMARMERAQRDGNRQLVEATNILRDIARAARSPVAAGKALGIL